MIDSPADFTLLFKADGAVELRNHKEKLVWSSDSDDNFIEEFGGETFFSDEEDSDDILNYLDEIAMINISEDEIDIVENDLNDETDNDNVIDADYEELNRG